MCEFNPSNAGRRIDPCMRGLIKALQREGINTIGCCCGHGKYPMSIVVKYSDCICEYITFKKIWRKKRFYRRDEDGYYYIPEVVKFKEEIGVKYGV